MIAISARETLERRFLVDGRYLGIDKLCDCLGRMSGVQFTVPLKSHWSYFVWSSENTNRIAQFVFRGHVYTVDDDCPFTGDIDVRSADAPLADVVAVQEHVERTALSPWRMRVESWLNPEFKAALARQQGAALKGGPATPSDSSEPSGGPPPVN
jgi:hypothetical protein